MIDSRSLFQSSSVSVNDTEPPPDQTELHFVHQSTLSNYSNLSSINFPSWTPDLILSLTFIIMGILTNISVLLMILFHDKLRTPFNVYLVNLLTINLVYFTLDAPTKIIDGLYQDWWLGDSFCSFYLYVTFNIEAMIFHGHALITINRIWAITLPVSYKKYHTKRLACLACFAIWVYVHLLGLPLVIRDLLYFRLNIEIDGCLINETPQYTLRVLFHFMSDSCGILVIGAYPFLLYKKRQRKQLEVGFSLRQRSTAHSSDVVKERSYAFTVLTFLTISSLVCWTSVEVYYGLRLFKIYVDSPVFFKIAYLLLDFAPVLDPLYFTIALKDLRTAFIMLVVKKNVMLPN